MRPQSAYSPIRGYMDIRTRYPSPAGSVARSAAAQPGGEDRQSRQLQPLEALALHAETDGSSSWEHRSHLLRPTASAAGTIGLSFRDRWLQELEPSVSLAETNSSSCWEHRSQFLRPTAPAVGIGLSLQLRPKIAGSCWNRDQQLQLLEPRPTAPAAGPLVLAPAANGPSYWGQWSHLLRPKFSSAKTNIST
ncbi:hypothetical protein PCANC_16869 [Puccinia coronata f. sp. avenae]|uniref:Uncharacterized protein n=1 Tax=Puccinia coronata f. sp. avenae TaxID=200324 RepID=A0A2N5SHW6_9BASI|nr:hypothetical protein PCANC_16869 [Puccinia coronata f. sp. avenae]